MKYWKCVALLASVLLGGCCAGNQGETVAAEENSRIDELYLKGIAAEEKEDYAAAVESLQKVLELLEKQSSPDRETLAATYEMLCSAYWNLKKYSEAEQAGLKALKLKKELYGERHLKVFDVECLLGAVCFDSNKLENAEQYSSSARAIMEQNPEVVSIEKRIWLYSKLSQIYCSVNKPEKFEESLQKVVSLCKSNPTHRIRLIVLYEELASVCAAYGRTNQAEKCYVEAARLAGEQLKEVSGEDLSLISYLVATTGAAKSFYVSQKQKDKVLMWGQILIRQCEKYLPEGNALTLKAYSEYADMLLGDPAGMPDEFMRSFIPEMKRLADKGNAEAQCNVSFWFSRGGVFKKEPDEKTGIEYLRKSAENGYAEAQFYMGMSCWSGHVVAQDKDEAIKWYRKAAEQGHAEAKKALAELEK